MNVHPVAAGHRGRPHPLVAELTAAGSTRSVGGDPQRQVRPGRRRPTRRTRRPRGARGCRRSAGRSRRPRRCDFSKRSMSTKSTSEALVGRRDDVLERLRCRPGALRRAAARGSRPTGPIATRSPALSDPRTLGEPGAAGSGACPAPPRWLAGRPSRSAPTGICEPSPALTQRLESMSPPTASAVESPSRVSTSSGSSSPGHLLDLAVSCSCDAPAPTHRRTSGRAPSVSQPVWSDDPERGGGVVGQPA